MGVLSHPHLLSFVEDHPEWTVEQSLDHRTVVATNVSFKYLIGWEGCSVEHNTWEAAANAVDGADLVPDYWLTLPPDQRLISQWLHCNDLPS